MKIKTLTLNNFKKFDNISINFTDNINCIIGSNGSGKTTILESIAFCLYGDLIDEFRNLPLHRVGTTKLSVNGMFHNSNKLQINRTYSIEGDSYNHDLIINGATLNAHEKNNIIRNNFGDIKWFDYLISVNQFSHIEFIDVANRSYRQFILNNLVNINFEYIKNNLKTLERKFKIEGNNNISKFISYEREVLKFNLIKNRLSEVKNNQNIIKEELKNSRFNYTNLINNVTKNKNNIGEMQLDINRLHDINDALNNIINNIEVYNDIVNESNLKEYDFDKEIDDVSLYIKNKILKINSLLKNKQNKINDLKLEINEMEEYKAELSNIIKINELKINENRYYLDNLESEYETLNKKQNDFIKIKSEIDNNNKTMRKISDISDLTQKAENKLIKNHIFNIITESNKILKKIHYKYKLIYNNNHLSLLLDNGIVNIHGLSAGEMIFINILIRCILYKLSIKSNFIMFDDPFARLDQDKIKDILKIFDIISNKKMQIIFTSLKEIQDDVKYNVINLDTINKNP